MDEMTKERRTPTILDVAKRAGVSKSTVSRVLTGSGYVGTETRQKVEEAIAKLGYSPNRAGRMLAKQRSNIIGVMTTDRTLINPERQLGIYVLHSMQRIANKTGYSTELFSASGPTSPGLAAIRAGECAGYIVFEYEKCTEVVHELMERKTPFVVINRYVTEPLIHTVCAAEKYGSRLLTEHLLDHGYTCLAFFGEKSDSPVTVATQRQLGFKEALTERGIPPAQQYIITAGEQFPWLTRMKEAGIKPAIIAHSDLQAMMVIKHAQRMGLRVLEDFVIGSFDNIQSGALISPALTTVDVRWQEMGEKAVDLLLGLMDDQGTSVVSKLILKPRLVVRESCGCKG